VHDIDKYTHLMRYLKDLPVVKKLDVKHIGRNDVTFKLSVAGGRIALVKSFGEDSLLTPLRDGGALDSQNLRYQMVA
jgi:hypothetical protein